MPRGTVVSTVFFPATYLARSIYAERPCDERPPAQKRTPAPLSYKETEKHSLPRRQCHQAGPWGTIQGGYCIDAKTRYRRVLAAGNEGLESQGKRVVRRTNTTEHSTISSRSPFSQARAGLDSDGCNQSHSSQPFPSACSGRSPAPPARSGTPLIPDYEWSVSEEVYYQWPPDWRVPVAKRAA